MNRLLQHFVDSSAAASAPASRPPIPAPPQSSGGSYNAVNRGSYQRAAPNGPFYYQPPQFQQRGGPFGAPAQLSEGHAGARGGGGLEEIPLSSQSTGGLYETVDLNAESCQQHRPPLQQHQQRLFTPLARPTSAPNSQGRGHAMPLYKAATPPASGGSGDGYQRNSQPSPPPFYQHQSAGSAAELFASAPPPPPPAAGVLFSGPPSGSGSNPYRRQAPPVTHASAPGTGSNVIQNNSSPPKDPFAASPSGSSGELFGRPAATEMDPFATPRSGSSSRSFGHAAKPTGNDPFAIHTPANNGFEPQNQEQRDQMERLETSADSFGAPANNSNPFASGPANSGSTPFTSSPANSGSSPFDSPAPSNGEHHRMASADSLFSSSAPTYNGEWSKPPQPPQPSPSKTRGHDLFPNGSPNASSLFGSGAPGAKMPPPPTQPQVPSSPEINAFPSTLKPPTNSHCSPVKVPQAGIPPPSPVKTQTRVPPSPVKTEGHLTSSLGSMKVSIPAKSPLKSGLDVRHVFNAKIPIGKREDDAVSLAPSLAPSRMSMLSTLDDSLKLSDMYKQMTARLEGEKNDLLMVVASQSDEIAQMKKQIKSLEQQLKKYRAQDA